jgi:hypothetical protein
VFGIPFTGFRIVFFKIPKDQSEAVNRIEKGQIIQGQNYIVDKRKYNDLQNTIHETKD